MPGSSIPAEGAMNAERDHKNWWVRAGDRVYGPYSREQMVGFVAEGRVAARTPVAYGADGVWRAADDVAWLAQAMFSAGQEAAASSAQPQAQILGKFIVWVDFGAFASSIQFESALRSLGQAYELAPGLWLLRADATVAKVRNTLSPTLGRDSRLLVVEAQKAAYYNLAPEFEARYRDADPRVVAAND